MLRGMFGDSEDESGSESDSSSPPPPPSSSPLHLTTSTVDSITVIQHQKAGISSQLWPAATALATFTLKTLQKLEMREPSLVNDGNNVNDWCDVVAPVVPPHLLQIHKNLQSLPSLFPKPLPSPLRILELGAGVGE